MKTNLFKSVALVAALLQLWDGVVYAAPDMVYRLNIPGSYGRITSRWNPSKHTTDVMVSLREKKSDKTVILIEDAHDQLRTQYHISHILQSLVPQCSIDNVVIGVEGAVGKINMRSLSLYPLQEARVKAAGKILDEGYIGGAEHAALSDHYIELYGLENNELFAKDYVLFCDLLKERKKIEDFLGQVASLLNMLENCVINIQLKQFHSSIEPFEKEGEGFEAYFSEILSFVDGKGFLENEYPSIYSFKEVLSARAGINLADMEKEIKEISSFVPPEKYTVQDEYGKQLTWEYLKHANPLAARKFPMLARHTEYMHLWAKVQVSELLRECRAVCHAVERNLVCSEEEARLCFLKEYLYLLKKVITLRAERGDVSEYVQRSRDMNVSECINRINKYARRYHMRELSEDYIFIDDIVQKALQFYTYAEAREEGMVSTLISQMKKEDKQCGVIVVGGYHSEGIVRILRERNISYVRITPHATETGEYRGYYDRMMGNLIPFSARSVSYITRILTSPREQNHIETVYAPAWLEATMQNPELVRRLIVSQESIRHPQIYALTERIAELERMKALPSLDANNMYQANALAQSISLISHEKSVPETIEHAVQCAGDVAFKTREGLYQEVMREVHALHAEFLYYSERPGRLERRMAFDLYERIVALCEKIDTYATVIQASNELKVPVAQFHSKRGSNIFSDLETIVASLRFAREVQNDMPDYYNAQKASNAVCRAAQWLTNYVQTQDTHAINNERNTESEIKLSAGRIPALSQLFSQAPIWQGLFEQSIFWMINVFLIPYVLPEVAPLISTSILWTIFIGLHFVRTSTMNPPPPFLSLFIIAGTNAMILASICTYFPLVAGMSMLEVLLYITIYHIGFHLGSLIHVILDSGAYGRFKEQIMVFKAMRYFKIPLRLRQGLIAAGVFGILCGMPNLVSAAQFSERINPETHHLENIVHVEKGDTLWDIAEKAYQNGGREWRKIFHYQGNEKVFQSRPHTLGVTLPDSKQVVIIKPHDTLVVPDMKELSTVVSKEKQEEDSVQHEERTTMTPALTAMHKKRKMNSFENTMSEKDQTAMTSSHGDKKEHVMQAQTEDRTDTYVHENLVRVQGETFTRPVVRDIFSPVHGKVSWVSHQESVPKGNPIIRVANQDLDASISMRARLILSLSEQVEAAQRAGVKKSEYLEMLLERNYEKYKMSIDEHRRNLHQYRAPVSLRMREQLVAIGSPVQAGLRVASYYDQERVRLDIRISRSKMNFDDVVGTVQGIPIKKMLRAEFIIDPESHVDEGIISLELLLEKPCNTMQSVQYDLMLQRKKKKIVPSVMVSSPIIAQADAFVNKRSEFEVHAPRLGTLKYVISSGTRVRKNDVIAEYTDAAFYKERKAELASMMGSIDAFLNHAEPHEGDVWDISRREVYTKWAKRKIELIKEQSMIEECLNDLSVRAPYNGMMIESGVGVEVVGEGQRIGRFISERVYIGALDTIKNDNHLVVIPEKVGAVPGDTVLVETWDKKQYQGTIKRIAKVIPSMESNFEGTHGLEIELNDKDMNLWPNQPVRILIPEKNKREKEGTLIPFHQAGVLGLGMLPLWRRRTKEVQDPKNPERRSFLKRSFLVLAAFGVSGCAAVPTPESLRYRPPRLMVYPVPETMTIPQVEQFAIRNNIGVYREQLAHLIQKAEEGKLDTSWSLEGKIGMTGDGTIAGTGLVSMKVPYIGDVAWGGNTIGGALALVYSLTTELIHMVRGTHTVQRLLAEKMTALAGYKLEATIADMVTQSTHALIDVGINEKRYAVIEAFRNEIKRSLLAADKRVREGFITRETLLRYEAQSTEWDQKAYEAERALYHARVDMKGYVHGDVLHADIPLLPHHSSIPPVMVQELIAEATGGNRDIVSNHLPSNPHVKQALLELHTLVLGETLQRSERFPFGTVESLCLQRDNDTSLIDLPSSVVRSSALSKGSNLGVSFAYTTGGKVRAEEETIRLSIEKARAHVADVQQKIAHAIEKNIIDLASAEKRLQQMNDRLAERERLLQSMYRKEGILYSPEELLLPHEAVVQERLSILEAQRELLKAEMRLRGLMGNSYRDSMKKTALIKRKVSHIHRRFVAVCLGIITCAALFISSDTRGQAAEMVYPRAQGGTPVSAWYLAPDAYKGPQILNQIKETAHPRGREELWQYMVNYAGDSVNGRVVADFILSTSYEDSIDRALIYLRDRKEILLLIEILQESHSMNKKTLAQKAYNALIDLYQSDERALAYLESSLFKELPQDKKVLVSQYVWSLVASGAMNDRKIERAILNIIRNNYMTRIELADVYVQYESYLSQDSPLRKQLLPLLYSEIKRRSAEQHIASFRKGQFSTLWDSIHWRIRKHHFREKKDFEADHNFLKTSVAWREMDLYISKTVSDNLNANVEGLLDDRRRHLSNRGEQKRPFVPLVDLREYNARYAERIYQSFSVLSSHEQQIHLSGLLQKKQYHEVEVVLKHYPRYAEMIVPVLMHTKQGRMMVLHAYGTYADQILRQNIEREPWNLYVEEGDVVTPSDAAVYSTAFFRMSNELNNPMFRYIAYRCMSDYELALQTDNYAQGEMRRRALAFALDFVSLEYAIVPRVSDGFYPETEPVRIILGDLMKRVKTFEGYDAYTYFEAMKNNIKAYPAKVRRDLDRISMLAEERFIQLSKGRSNAHHIKKDYWGTILLIMLNLGIFAVGARLYPRIAKKYRHLYTIDRDQAPVQYEQEEDVVLRSVLVHAEKELRDAGWDADPHTCEPRCSRVLNDLKILVNHNRITIDSIKNPRKMKARYYQVYDLAMRSHERIYHTLLLTTDQRIRHRYAFMCDIALQIAEYAEEMMVALENLSTIHMITSYHFPLSHVFERSGLLPFIRRIFYFHTAFRKARQHFTHHSTVAFHLGNRIEPGLYRETEHMHSAFQRLIERLIRKEDDVLVGMDAAMLYRRAASRIIPFMLGSIPMILITFSAAGGWGATIFTVPQALGSLVTGGCVTMLIHWILISRGMSTRKHKERMHLLDEKKRQALQYVEIGGSTIKDRLIQEEFQRGIERLQQEMSALEPTCDMIVIAYGAIEDRERRAYLEKMLMERKNVLYRVPVHLVASRGKGTGALFYETVEYIQTVFPELLKDDSYAHLKGKTLYDMRIAIIFAGSAHVGYPENADEKSDAMIPLPFAINGIPARTLDMSLINAYKSTAELARQNKGGMVVVFPDGVHISPTDLLHDQDITLGCQWVTVKEVLGQSLGLPLVDLLSDSQSIMRMYEKFPVHRLNDKLYRGVSLLPFLPENDEKKQMVAFTGHVVISNGNQTGYRALFDVAHFVSALPYEVHYDFVRDIIIPFLRIHNENPMDTYETIRKRSVSDAIQQTAVHSLYQFYTDHANQLQYDIRAHVPYHDESLYVHLCDDELCKDAREKFEKSIAGAYDIHIRPAQSTASVTQQSMHMERLRKTRTCERFPIRYEEGAKLTDAEWQSLTLLLQYITKQYYGLVSEALLQGVNIYIVQEERGSDTVRDSAIVISRSMLRRTYGHKQLLWTDEVIVAQALYSEIEKTRAVTADALRILQEKLRMNQSSDHHWVAMTLATRSPEESRVLMEQLFWRWYRYMKMPFSLIEGKLRPYTTKGHFIPLNDAETYAKGVLYITLSEMTSENRGADSMQDSGREMMNEIDFVWKSVYPFLFHLKQYIQAQSKHEYIDAVLYESIDNLIYEGEHKSRSMTAMLRSLLSQETERKPLRIYPVKELSESRWFYFLQATLEMQKHHGLLYEFVSRPEQADVIFAWHARYQDIQYMTDRTLFFSKDAIRFFSEVLVLPVLLVHLQIEKKRRNSVQFSFKQLLPLWVDVQGDRISLRNELIEPLYAVLHRERLNAIINYAA